MTRIHLKFVQGMLAAALAATLAVAGEPAARPVVSDATMSLLTQAQAAAKTNNPEQAATAYAKVFEATDLTLDQRIAAHSDLARVYSAKARHDLAAGEFDRALAAQGLTPAYKLKLLSSKAKMRFDSNFQGAWASYFTTGIEKAADIYRQIASTPEFPASDRIDAFNSLANCQLELTNSEAANKTLQEALALPDLKENEQFAARKNIADSLFRQQAFEKALAAYREIWSAKLHVSTRTYIENRIVSILLRQNKSDDTERALLEWQRPPLGLAHFYAGNGAPDKARKTCEDMLADRKNSFKDRCDAVEALMQLQAGSGGAREFIAYAESSVAPLIAENEKAWEFYPKINTQFSRYAFANSDDYKKWILEKMLGAPAVSAGEFLKHSENLFNLLVKRGDIDAAKSIASKAVVKKELSANARLQYDIYLAIFDANGSEQGIFDKAKAVIGNMDKADDPAKRAEALLLSARAALTCRHEGAAKRLYAEREKMLVPEERRSLNCTFLKDGPRDITGFMQSEYFKNAWNRGRLDRKYGDNLQFLLETDSALTGRKVTDKTGELTPTEFVATCDEDGIKVFFFVTTPKARDFADGLASLGGYEMYLAAGTDAPYHTYLVDMPPGGMNDDFVTQYNNANFRRARQKENMAKIEHAAFSNGVATLISLSWEAFFNELPGDGTKWDFEAIHWEQGGYSWGGSKSVHNRSSFGALVFANMTKENVNAIKRRLIPKALKAYRNEACPNNGYLENWQDPELGDQKFYLEVIKPLQSRLDGFVEKVKPGLSADDVETLYAEAVPQWMNIKFTVANLRRDYLDALRIKGW